MPNRYRECLTLVDQQHRWISIDLQPLRQLTLLVMHGANIIGCQGFSEVVSIEPKLFSQFAYRQSQTFRASV